MPEGILDFFEPVWMETQSLDSRESKKDILYSSSLHIYLDERDNRPDDLQELRPNGFTEETVNLGLMDGRVCRRISLLCCKDFVYKSKQLN